MPTYARLKSRIPEIMEAGTVRTHKAAATAAANIERRCKEKSRVDTGNMRGSWQIEVIEEGEYEVFNPVEYTIFNEFGTIFMSAQPMLVPSVDETLPEFIDDVRHAWGL